MTVSTDVSYSRVSGVPPLRPQLPFQDYTSDCVYMVK